MSEVQNLIMSVEQYPCLWDTNHADYHNREVKDLAWEEICKEVIGSDWEKSPDKANKCAELKKKWTNIRDYYRKGIQKAKNDPTGSAAKKAKTYVYGDLLYFLTPVFTKRNSEGNFPKEEDSESIQTQNEELYIEPEVISYMQSPEPTLRVVNHKKLKDVPMNDEQTAANTDEDDDTKYLLSFRSYMKAMNPHQKMDFKMGMLQLVKTITMENDASSPQTRYMAYYHHPDHSPAQLLVAGNSPSPSPPTIRSFSQQQKGGRKRSIS